MEHQVITGGAHTRRGRRQAVKRFVELNGYRPDASVIKSKYARSGSTNESIKIYKDDDGDEWDFSQKEQEAVASKRCVDDGGLQAEAGPEYMQD